MPATASFFALGGHSISVGQLVNKVRRELRLKISVGDVYAACSAHALALKLVEEEVERPPVASDERSYVASYQQRSMEAMANLGAKASAALNLSFCCHLRCARGDLDVPRLQKAFEALVRRHDALRTTVKDSMCEVCDMGCDFRVESAVELLEPQLEAFDLQRGPLCRVRLQQEKQRWILHWTLHHVSADLWSYTLLLRDLNEAYEQLERGPVEWPQAPQYRDYAIEEQRLRGKAREERDKSAAL